MLPSCGSSNGMSPAAAPFAMARAIAVDTVDAGCTVTASIDSAAGVSGPTVSAIGMTAEAGAEGAALVTACANGAAGGLAGGSLGAGA